MLEIPKAIYDAIITHCRSRYPKEACGILAGQPSASRSVAQVYPMTNVEDSPIGYSMDPREQLAVERQMRQLRQRMAGIYHSHTASDAYPSPVDERLSIGPELSYVLVSLQQRDTPVLRSYRIDSLGPPGQRIVEERVLIIDRPSGEAGRSEAGRRGVA